MENFGEELNIYSEEVKDVLSDPPRAIFRWGNTILFIFIIIILFLSWLIKYPDIVTSQATLTTEVPPQKEFARVTGKIDSIFVSNYDKVGKGQTLALIENTAVYEDVVYLKSILDTLEVSSGSFNFPLDEIPMLFLGEIENEYAEFERNYIQYSLNRDSESFLNQDLTTKYTLSQLKYRLKTLINQQKLNEEELQFKKKDLERTKKLYEKGVFSMQEFENKKLEFLQAERGYRNLSVSISQTKEEISNTKNIKKQTAIDNTREEINLYKAVLQSLDDLKMSIKDWEQKYLFKSNIEGTVSFMKVWNENQTINIGDFVFTIVPKNHSSYICKVKAPILNSGKVKIGQDVNIRLSGYPDNEYGVLRGTVMNISLVPNNEGFYLIDVQLPNKLVTTYNKELEFRQETQGIAEIITEDLRLINRVFYQFRDIFKQ